MSKLNDLENPDGVPFPPSRLLMDDHVQMYYNFCRAAPEDVLSCVTGPSRPLVLLLAPGDTRSLIYTLYRNFDPEFRGRFEGADFLVNENWTLLLARHVLILQLCLQLPHKIESEEGRYMCAAVWAICYNPTLRPPHLPILKKALSELLRYGCALDVWYCPENPLGRIVKFSNEKTFNAVVKHWVIWSEDSPSYVPTVVRLQELRYSFLMLQHAESMRYVVNAFSEQCVAYLLGLTADTVPKKIQRLMWEEFANFLQLSLAYAEEMLELPVDKDWEPKVNPTFFDGSSHTWKHSPFYGRVPFFGFFHSFLFTPSGCRQGNIARSLCDKLLVADDKFESHPLLANSLQQMIIWFSATSRALRKLTVQTSPCVTFTFHCSDPITLCMRLQQSPELYASSLGADPSFDLVHSFEGVDAISPPDLILHATPLLKQDCFLIVKTVDYRTIAPTLESYLGSVFGVHPQIFPVMYGIRCVGEDGSFADCSVIRHTMWDQAHRRKGHDVQTLVFQRLLTTPFVLDSLDEIDFAPRALVSCIHATTYNFPVNRYAHMMSMETVVTGIFAFISQMEANTPIHRWQFWDGYVRLIKEEKTLESYRHHIQTVAMLHGIHLHITVTERDCPICRYRPLSSFISFFSVAIKDPEMVPHMTIGLFVHPEARRAENFLSNAKDSHAIHSVALRKGDEKGQCFIEFFFPKEFVEKSYKLTVVKFTERDILGRKVQVPELLHQDLLEESMAKGPPRYKFQQLPKRRSSISSGFGDLQLHVAGCEKANSVLDIPSNLVYRLDCSNMIVDSDEVSQMHLCLKVSEYCKYDIYYPYPVVFSEMKIQFHCKDDTATITAPRDHHAYHATPPLFLVTPTNRLFLPAAPVNPSLSRDYLALQMSPVEEELHSRKVSKWVPPIIRLKYILRDLFQLASSGCRFVHVHTTKTGSDSKLQGMIIIHDEVIDLDTRSPAIDLSFSFLKGKEEETEFAATWIKITSDHTSRVFSLPHENLEHFTRMLGYYASRTHTVYTDNNRTSLCRIKILRRNSIDSFFTRAVVFPMYASTDQQVGKPSEDPKGAEQSAMKKIPHFIAGVFSQGGVPVNDEVKKVIDSLSPSKRNSEGGRSGGTQISVTTHTANLDVFGALFEALQGSPNAKTSQLLHMFAELPSSVTIGPIALSTGEDERRSRTGTRTTTETGGGTKSSAAGGAGAAAKPVPPTPKPRELKETREKLKEKMRQKAKERTKEKVRAAQVSSPTAEERRGKSKSAEGNSKTEKSKPLKKENKPSNTEENPSTKKGKSTAVAEEKTSAKEPKSSTNEVKTSTKVEAGEVKPPQEKPPQPPETAPKKEERGGEGGKKTGSDPVYSGALEDEEDSTSGGKHKNKSNGKEGVRSKSKCTNCGRSSDHMKKCAGCGGPRYCSRECQRQHWKQHKPHCTSEDKAGEGKREKEPAVPKPPPREKPAEVAPTMFTCTSCGRTSENLKRCKCVKAFYCGTECQRKDWPRHKQTCSAAPLKKN